MTLINYLEAGIRNRIALLRGLLLKVYLLLHGCGVGKKLKCLRWPLFRIPPQDNITIGHNVTIGYRITLDVHEHGTLFLGDRVNLTQDIMISAATSVRIGADSLIGEQVSIRDADHGIQPGLLIAQQPIESSPVEIGRDVWIASGCRILKGSLVPEGTVIGANSVVLGGHDLMPQGIYAGTPVRLIRLRSDKNSSRTKQ